MDALKFVDGTPGTIEGWGAPYGGLHRGKDLAGEAFGKNTDFCESWFSERPLLFNHGLTAGTDTTVVGRVKTWEKRDKGLWVQAQLDAQGEYFEAIKELVDAGKLYFSSGAMAHLVRTDKSTGEIKRWPWVELSLTPTPCNLLATLGDATKHFKAAGLDGACLKALMESADAAGGFAAPEDDDADDGVYPCAACAAGDEAACTCPGCARDGACVCCALLAGAAMGGDTADDAAKTWPNAHYLHREAGKGYGLYRDATGTVDARLLERAMSEVEGSPLPPETKAAALAHARSLADAHDMAAVTTVTTVKTVAGDESRARHRVAMRAPQGAGAPPLKATWTTAYVDDLNDSSFLYVEDGGRKDSGGKTTPRALRHFPYKGADGAVDLPHLRNALARIPQSSLPDDIKQAVAAKARRIAKANGIESEAAKAMVDVLDILAHGDGEAPEGSYEGCYEDLIGDISALLNPSNPWAGGAYTSILRTYPTYVICCRYGDGEQTFWRIPYSLDRVGEPALGDPIQVEQEYVPAKAFVDAGPIALNAITVARAAAALGQRTQDLFERRTKDGRVFSTASVKELSASAEQSIAAGRKILDLLDASTRREREAAKAAYLATPESRERLLRLLELAAR